MGEVRFGQVRPLKAIWNVERRELPLVALMFLYFFLVITTFWILKPIKKAVFIGYYLPEGVSFFGLSGPQAEQLAKVANMGIALGAVIVFTLLARRLRRQQLTYVFCGFSLAMLVLFSFWVRDDGEVAAWALYLFGDLYNTLMVATFFAFLSDSVSPQTARRTYGPIVLGGVLGGVVGSTFVAGATAAGGIDNSTWMWICFATTAAIALCAGAAGALVRRHPPPEEPARVKEEEPAQPKRSAALEGAALVLRSRYLLALVAMVGLYEIISTIMDFQFTATIAHYAESEAAYEAQQNTVFAITNWTALLLQVFVTPLVMARFGVRVALLIMPVVIFANSAAFLVVPALWVGSLLNTSDNAFNYTLNQSSREALYTVTTRDEKYKAKAFIDMFMQRAAKALGVGLNLAISIAIAGLAGLRGLSVLTVVLVSMWVVAAVYAGRKFQERAEALGEGEGEGEGRG